MLVLTRLAAPFAAVALMFAAFAAPTHAGMNKADIVDTAVSNGNFKTLAAALQSAELIDTLKGKGPFTVFAPNDAAFAKLPDGTVEKLLMPENKQALVMILTYHVVPGKVMSSDIAGKKVSPATVEGQKVAIDASGSSVKVANATVVAADVGASNGVIHVIDTVMIPEGVTIK